MSRDLTIQQRNNLCIGNRLAAEVPASSDDCRAFVVIGAYLPSDHGSGGARPPKALNSPEHDKLCFWLRSYEVERRVLAREDDWVLRDEDLHRSVRRRGIASFEELEHALHEYLDDFAALDVEWRRDNPI